MPKKKSYYKPKPKKIDPNLIDQIRKQVLEELKADDTRKEAQAEKARQEGDAVRTEFVERMKASSEPWVDILMWVETPTGVKYQLDWNDAFIKTLREQGVAGIDDDTVVQRWVALLLRQATDNMEQRFNENLQEKNESEFQ